MSALLTQEYPALDTIQRGQPFTFDGLSCFELIIHSVLELQLGYWRGVKVREA